MAVALIFGLTFATSITLIVVPVVYSIFHRISYNVNSHSALDAESR